MNDVLRLLGIRTLRRAYRSLRLAPLHVECWRRFLRDYETYCTLERPDRRPSRRHLMPYVLDATESTPIEPIYFYQDAWAFERIVANAPERHVDVGSHHKFVALLSKVLPVTMIDLRPLSVPLDSLDFVEGSILDLPFEDRTLSSLSSLCVVEHIGLGRYGDELDPDGSAKAIKELARVVAPGGRLYLSVPVGDEYIVAFNAGRVLPRAFVLENAAPLELVQERHIVGGVFKETYTPGPPFTVTGLYEFRCP